MKDYELALRFFVYSAIRKRVFELLNPPEVIVNHQLQLYNRQKSELEAHPDRLPRIMELELMLKFIEDEYKYKSTPLCGLCVNNKQLAELLSMDLGNVPSVKDAGHVYKQVICDKVKVTLEDELMYVCPHFEKLAYVSADDLFEKPSEPQKQAAADIKKEFQAELEKLSGQPKRRI